MNYLKDGKITYQFMKLTKKVQQRVTFLVKLFKKLQKLYQTSGVVQLTYPVQTRQ